ncbi:MAG: hypothetical protein IPM96_21740 [Ignavibacteria bacterium]|nr:hypothetical protein [Ignavibacteria bacterium]
MLKVLWLNDLKKKCFPRTIMVGIIGVKSGFDGKVYDIPSYPKRLVNLKLMKDLSMQLFLEPLIIWNYYLML